MDNRKLEILKTDASKFLSLSQHGLGGDIIARIELDDSDALREVVRRWNAYKELMARMEQYRCKLETICNEIQEYGFIGVEGVGPEHENHWSGSPAMQDAIKLLNS